MRGAWTGSTLNGVCLENEWGSSFWWKKDGTLRRPELCFPGLPYGRHAAKINIISSLSVPSARKTIDPLSAAAPALSPPTLDTQEQFRSEEMDSAYGFKTVHVKFQLQKECSFGQQFLMVGDDPMFGAWDPSKAVPLTWSEGHVWTLEMDIPTGKSIVYKFLLKEADDTILWQPDPDRVVETWETNNTITVCEDWDNAELQNIIERGVVDGGPESAPYLGMLIAENLTQPWVDPKADALENITDHDKSSANEPSVIVADNITGAEKEVNASNVSDSRDASAYLNMGVITGLTDFGDNGTAMNGTTVTSKDEAGLVFDEGIPVLVPGLNQILAEESESVPLSEVQTETDAEGLVVSSKAKEFNLPELNSKEEFPTDSSLDKETFEMVFNDMREIGDNNGDVETPELEDESNGQPSELSVFESDIHWGRRTLQKFLTNLGLL